MEYEDIKEKEEKIENNEQEGDESAVSDNQEKYYGMQEKGSYCNMDLHEEDEIKAAELEDENREKGDKPLVKESEDDAIREEKVEDKNAEELPIKQGNEDDVKVGAENEVEVRLDHIAMKLEENKTGEAIKEVTFWEKDSKEEEEWKEQKEECTIGKGESHNSNEEREKETDENVGREEKYLTREEENQEDDVKDNEFANAEERGIEEIFGKKRSVPLRRKRVKK